MRTIRFCAAVLLPLSGASCASHPRARRPQAHLVALALMAWMTGVLITDLHAASAALVGWSERGLHEFSGTDFSVFSLHPPYSTIRAQLMVAGRLVTNDPTVTVTYQAVADVNGSINSTSAGKGNFYDFVEGLHGIALAPNEGLAGFSMPGLANAPQRMALDAARKGYMAEGLPLFPIDDAGRKNPYPMMRLVARNGAGTVLATTDIAVPISDELDCRACHASGSSSVARPNGGWVWNCDPDRDYKLNILQKHDDRHLGSIAYANALIETGYDLAGLVVSATRNHKPVLCIACHASNESPGSGAEGMRPLTQLIHAKHSYVADPQRGLPLSLYNDSSVCLQCHSGPETRYLRGSHRKSVNSDGTSLMQCQNCHGNMLAVGKTGRQGWLDEPSCQSCHTGDAMQNSGQIRYTSVFDVTGQVRQPPNQIFATQSNTPTAGLNLFSHSQGHGGLQCAACHGPAHGEWPSMEANENVQSQRLQGNAGTLLRCTACHLTTPSTVTGGPHGLHSVSQNWAEDHHDLIGDEDRGSTLQCRTCHGSNYRGTVLSLAGTDNTFTGRGTHHFWPGFQTGCYDCHNGPTEEDRNTNIPPTVSNLTTNTTPGLAVAVALIANDPENRPLTHHIVSPPAHGRVSLSGGLATYFPVPDFIGSDSFTFAALDGATDSNLASVGVTVNPAECVLFSQPAVPRAAFPSVSVPFRANAVLRGCLGSIQFNWDFGDGSAHSAASDVCHAFSTDGDYAWTLTMTAGGSVLTTNGVITISSTLGPPLMLSIENWYFQMNLSWPWDPIPVALESSPDPGNPLSWIPVYDPPSFDPFSGNMNVQQFILPDQQFFRLRRVP